MEVVQPHLADEACRVDSAKWGYMVRSAQDTVMITPAVGSKCGPGLLLPCASWRGRGTEHQGGEFVR